MFSRIRIAALIAAAAGTPYVASETQWGRDAIGTVSSTAKSTSVPGFGNASATSTSYGNHAHHEVETLRRSDSDRFRYEEDLARKLGGLPSDPGATPQVTGIRVQDLRSVMRFDISPDWVISQFARVSTVLADVKLEGLRVPIVTGTQASDIAGTLTYYFDHRQKLQRLTLHGFTGDPGRIVQTMTSDYGLAPEPALEAGVYTKRWNGNPVHFLRLSFAPVVYSDAVHQKYTVFLELNQPNLIYGVSPEAQKIVNSDRGSGRW